MLALKSTLSQLRLVLVTKRSIQISRSKIYTTLYTKYIKSSKNYLQKGSWPESYFKKDTKKKDFQEVFKRLQEILKTFQEMSTRKFQDMSKNFNKILKMSQEISSRQYSKKKILRKYSRSPWTKFQDIQKVLVDFHQVPGSRFKNPGKIIRFQEISSRKYQSSPRSSRKYSINIPRNHNNIPRSHKIIPRSHKIVPRGHKIHKIIPKSQKIISRGQKNYSKTSQQ